MLEKFVIINYEEFCRKIKSLECDKLRNVVMLFVASREGEKISWCSDCRNAIPIVESAVNEFNALDGIFLYVDVGARDIWKDMNNPFRLDEKLKLNSVPTLMLLDGVEKLEENDCQEVDTVKSFFSKLQNI